MLAIINTCVCFLIFFIDLQFPLEISSGIPYIIVILLSQWLPKIRHTIYFATLCTFLDLTKFAIFSYQSAALTWQATTLWLETLLSIWVAAIIVSYGKVFSRKIKNMEIRQTAILAASLDPIITFSINGIITYASDSIATVSGFESKSIINKHITCLFAEQHKNEIIKLINCRNKLQFKQEMSMVNLNNQEFICEVSISKITLINPKEVFFTLIIHNVNERKEAEQKLIWLSTHDELTGIFNRRYFNTQLNTEWRRLIREKNPVAVILIDVDKFKNYNDSLGHQEGDDCLRMIAQLLDKRLNRPSDFVARYGGEEFIILLPNTDLDGARTVADKVQQDLYTLNIPHPSSNVSDRVTVSMGISAIIPTTEYTPEFVVKRADEALYQAKDGGRNRFVA